MSATWRLLPRIEAMMFCAGRLVKQAWIGMDLGLRKMSRKLGLREAARVAVGNGGRSALSIAP